MPRPWAAGLRACRATRLELQRRRDRQRLPVRPRRPPAAGRAALRPIGPAARLRPRLREHRPADRPRRAGRRRFQCVPDPLLRAGHQPGGEPAGRAADRGPADHHTAARRGDEGDDPAPNPDTHAGPGERDDPAPNLDTHAGPDERASLGGRRRLGRRLRRGLRSRLRGGLGCRLRGRGGRRLRGGDGRGPAASARASARAVGAGACGRRRRTRPRRDRSRPAARRHRLAGGVRGPAGVGGGRCDGGFDAGCRAACSPRGAGATGAPGAGRPAGRRQTSSRRRGRAAASHGRAVSCA